MSRNGESWLLRQVIGIHRAINPAEPFVAFDGGANRGDYTSAILRSALEAKCPVSIHMFEPSPACAEVLHQQFSRVEGVQITRAALSDHDGVGNLYGGKTGSSQASLTPRTITNFTPSEAVEVPLLRLCDYIDQQNVGHINLLKLDVEGSELQALRGLQQYLRPSRIDVIQFEYGGATLDSGSSLRELFEICENNGFIMTKLFPRRLDHRSYRPWMDSFAYANYVAASPRWLHAS